MTIRAAQFVDIPAMVEVMRRGYERSIYAGRATFNVNGTKQLLVQAINRHNGRGPGATLVMVAEKDKRICGLMIGMLDHVYPCLDELMATDLMFLFDEDANPKDALAMVRQLESWAESIDRVIEVHLGVTNAIGDYERTGKLYSHLGMQQCGAMYQRGLGR